jgi:hypothetical protein
LSAKVIRLPTTHPPALARPQLNVLTRASIIFVHGLRGHPRDTWASPRDIDINPQGPQDETPAGAASNTPSRRKGIQSLFGLRKTSDKPTTSKTEHPAAPPTTEVFWPEEYLALEIQDARVWTYGYNADVIGGLFASNNQNSISQHGRDLAVRLDRDVDNQVLPRRCTESH